eukprot:415199-Prorocentrum_minimum.AAC.1
MHARVDPHPPVSSIHTKRPFWADLSPGPVDTWPATLGAGGIAGTARCARSRPASIRGLRALVGIPSGRRVGRREWKDQSSASGAATQTRTA